MRTAQCKVFNHSGDASASHYCSAFYSADRLALEESDPAVRHAIGQSIDTDCFIRPRIGDMETQGASSVRANRKRRGSINMEAPLPQPEEIRLTDPRVAGV